MSESYSDNPFTQKAIEQARGSDDPLAFCRQHPEIVRELLEFCETEGYGQFAKACRAVLEEVDQS